MNLRQFLKVYHAGHSEIPFYKHEIEVLNFDEFQSFVQEQRIFSQDDLQKYAPFSESPLEDILESMLDSLQCMHQI